ncbi:hypothetical protein ACFVTF_05020 [Kitasatospora sp. NPDC057940]
MIRTRIAKAAAVAALVSPPVSSLVTATPLQTPPLVSIDAMFWQ